MRSRDDSRYIDIFRLVPNLQGKVQTGHSDDTARVAVRVNALAFRVEEIDKQRENISTFPVRAQEKRHIRINAESSKKICLKWAEDEQ